MKNNIKTILLFVLISISGYAQDISTELPILSPQSPTTNDLGKYGEVQVNESTGIISPSIPLFEYYAGAMSLPIVLNYSGNGVRVNQDPTWAGVNWNINPGGVITRVVKDKPDELTDLTNRIYYSEQELENLEGARAVHSNGLDLDKSTDWYKALNHLSFQNTDSELDIFNYNFLGYSGSFYLDVDNNVHLIKYDKELSINLLEISNGDNIFIIKTPDGNTYFFGGQNASESSRTWVNNGAGSTANIPYTQNAFYLYEISFLTGGSINFQYENFDTTSDAYKIGIQESASYSFMNVNCNKTAKTLHSDVKKFVRLKKITSTFNSQFIEFESNFYGTSNRMTKLNNIYLKNGNEILKKIHLDFLVINNETLVEERKFFLNKVEFFGKNNVFEYDYELEYTSPQFFPSKNSFAQDHMGYYNGQNSNTTLLPKTTNFLINSNCFFGLANRDADFNSSLIGALKQIKYPTGGYSEFEYELPYKGQEYIFSDVFLTAYYRDENRDFESSVHNCITNINYYSQGLYFPSGDGSLIVDNQVTINTIINVQINGFYSHPVKAKLIAINQNNQEISTSFTINEGNYDNSILSENFNLVLPQGSYIFNFVLEIHNADSHSCNNSTSNTLNSVIAIAQFGLPTGIKQVYHPGLRIKRVTTFGSNGTSNIVRYYYNKLANFSQESFVYEPKYIFKSWILNLESAFGIFNELYHLSTNSVNNVFNNDMGNFIYEYVTTSYGGDNFENGGKESRFLKFGNTPPTLYKTHPLMNSYFELFTYGSTTGTGGSPITYANNFELDYTTIVDISTNDSYQNSVLESENYFNKNFKILRSNKFNYVGEVDTIGYNIKVTNLLNIPSTGTSRNITYYSYFLYQTKSYKYRLMSTETKEYVGANLTDEISSVVTHTYTADKVSLPSKIEVINSSGETNKTKVYYPSDALSISNLSSTDMGLLNTLQTGKHNVAEVVKIENYKNNVLLQTKQKSYQNWLGNILPKTISSSKGTNTTEERIEFFNYDFYGKPLLVSQKEGTKTAYEYNAKGQVILKIENISTIDDIGDGAEVLNDPCYYHNLYPNSMVTKYDYDPITNNIIRIIDPKCDYYTYHYDDFNRLQYVKDKNGNILSENKYNYKN